MFGICKHEKGTKRGKFENKPLQQTSYQMLNSLGADKEVMRKLSEFEIYFIKDLKNNDDKFIEYIKQEANDVNCNMMLVNLYEINKDIVRTKMFRDFRAKTISNYVKHIKKGKLRLIGDYCTLLSCPMEYLYKAVGEIGNEINRPMALKDNEVYTTLFGDEGFGNDYVAFRNPHTSMSNVLIVKNVRNKDIETYFKLTPNIVVINTIGSLILEILSGADMDSDCIAIFDNPDLMKLAKNCYKKFNVCVNGIDADPTEYTLSKAQASIIDNLLSDGQMNIGEVVNLGQLALSLYFDVLNKNKKPVKLLKKVDVMTVLSGCAIDSAKRSYDIDLSEEIDEVRSDLILKKKKVEIENKKTKKLEVKEVSAKPNFWRYVTENKNTHYKHYNCPMDFLYEIMGELDKAESREHLDVSELLVKRDYKKGNRKQIPRAEELASELQDKITKIKKERVNYKVSKEEEFNKIEDTTEEYTTKFNKLKINENTMYVILSKISKEFEPEEKEKVVINNLGDEEKQRKEGGEVKKNKSLVRLMNQLYKTQETIFLNAFLKQ
ncbi:hypothetical protein M5V91_10895 [Cytobacillus pseudoceanisediminis]|uniref:hypothetical protein n=1 Tax=Cytobacillus pseudoceanisediminis TaxID=3051614 RepID=UPI0021871021|nr:hypothetical protein [Cytobacillus pseudoceanisediminis]UQX56085.1 hypothetical protein M5V91_10895 [Cytobacillus pseudoceanisediminis]